jgi:AsmA protein
VQGGVAQNDDLRLDAKLVTASGAGRVDIGGQSLDYRLSPKLLEGQTNGGLAVPVLIAGPWAAPKIRLDLEALARENLANEIEAVKAEGERLILDKLEAETGVSAERLSDVEGAVRSAVETRVEQRIEKEVGGALRGLLGR